jgi:hypothetical protein
MPENLNRPVTKKDILVLVLVIFLFVIPFFGATVFKQAFPDNAVIKFFFDEWWKTIIILGAGIYLGNIAEKWIYKKMK